MWCRVVIVSLTVPGDSSLLSFWSDCEGYIDIVKGRNNAIQSKRVLQTVSPGFPICPISQSFIGVVTTFLNVPAETLAKASSLRGVTFRGVCDVLGTYK
jgi:hypothetical protein